MGLTSLFWDWNGEKTNNCVSSIWDWNRNYQKAFQQFGTGTGIHQKNSRYSGQKQEMPKNISRCSGT